ncbi:MULTISPECIES: hypothetical protein [Gammaproteobacteria]|uniref:hypothetical protein n=1 Tax=Gammaproteobacteria TaxID=1236 RepID=UPI000DCFC30A|nr:MULTISPECIES: hypothetical protein [Gammaproteobacteria]RTE86264.1 hypothetical protein DQX04_06760 [Aliidiomarina sp. B3213]TCZ91615.1 hypothetical protein EYQ95_06770 [Lysobacter sp. N42]
MKRAYWILFLGVLITWKADALVPPKISTSELFKDAGFIGVVEIAEVHATLGYDTWGSVCGVTYRAHVEESVKGPITNEELFLHVLSNSQNEVLEVGEKYFVYAEGRESQESVLLESPFRRDLEFFPEDCFSKIDSALYVDLRFSPKMEEIVGVEAVTSWGIERINGTTELRSVWFHESSGRSLVAVKKFPDFYIERLTRQGIVLEDLLSYFRVELELLEERQ